MKRFWKAVSVSAATGGGWTILLDGRPVRTPARAALAVPQRALAEAIAAEWDAQTQDIDPDAMPMTGFANAVIDRIAPDPAIFVADLAGYGESDVLCYRAEAPPPLVTRQAERWDPLLDWARARYDIHFEIVTGVMHRDQPPATVRRLGDALAACDPFRLAAMSSLVTISGSLVTALAVLEGHVDADTAFDVTHLDELWQIELWGEDAQAATQRGLHRRDFLAAARFLSLLD